MLTQRLVRGAARVFTQTSSRRAYASTTSTTTTGPIRQFFANGVPIDVYPLIFLTGGVATFATYSISKHILQDRDHLRWMPGKGGVKFQLKDA